MSTPWKILVLAHRDAELNPLRRELERAGIAAELTLVRNGDALVKKFEGGGWDAALFSGSVARLHLASALAELRRRDPLLPIVLVVRAIEAEGLLAVAKSGVSAVVFQETLALVAITLEREVLHYREARGQQQSRQRAAWLDQAMGCAPVALAIADRRGVLRWANAAYLELVGVRSDQLEAGEATIWESGDERWADLSEALHAGRAWRGSVPAPARGGEATLHQLQIAGLPMESEEMWYVVARQPVGGATPGIENRLREQRNELFAAIAGGIAHDLNNILAPITMAANILGEQELSAESGELVRTIENSAERGAAVIRQVLTFAQGSENCAMVLQPRHLLREVARLAAEVFPPNIAVRADIPSALWAIVGDPGEIHQSLINVLINSRDAMPEGGHIVITARNRTFPVVPSTPFFSPEAGDFVEITVDDTGEGLEPDVASHAWEPFVTTKGAGHGSGLGLCRVAGVLRSHGGFGQMRARPDAEHGTRVSLCFPRAVSASDAAPTPTAGLEVSPREVGRILVVDDEESILTLSRRILERAGFEVLVASEGREALALFARHRAEIGLVVTDLAMPGMNGFTLVWALRRSKPDLRVMVATGQGTDANLRELERMGVREVLLKPFSSRRLLDGVARTMAEPAQCEPDLFLDAAFAQGA